ncbi:hypothetical protein N1851_026926 [Merluccius polli]|uniref:Endonuclease/exonuclease/phosphatase domain-containing protein n=1 Tax=Merluccius polli TaxID=89951 RepID=A0AA47MAW4_MERPO|nr:hypothetical protein N1851_026926 [Merluccius polli]
MSLELVCDAEDQQAQAPAFACRPADIAPNPNAYPYRWWANRAAAPCCFFGLCLAEPHGSRPSHQTLAGELPSQVWLQEGAPVSLFRGCWGRSWEFAHPVYMCFVDLEKAYDRVPWGILWGVLREYGVLVFQQDRHRGFTVMCPRRAALSRTHDDDDDDDDGAVHPALCGITYDKQTLIDIGKNWLPSVGNNSDWPREILQRTIDTDRTNPTIGRRRPRGKRSGTMNRLRRRAHSTPLPSILLANVQSLENNLDDLRARIRYQRDIRDCNIICLTETWLTPMTPDHAIQPAEHFSVHRMDRTEESGKSRGGGLCLMTNNNWCDRRNVVPLTHSCSPNLELLTIKCRPFYLPREFTSIIISAVYIPPQADTVTALSELHEVLAGHQTTLRDAALIVAGDFNRANLKTVRPDLRQHITCATRGERTLDHCYSPFKDGYRAKSLPPFGKSDHAAILLIPKYKQRLKQEAPVRREVTRWSDQSEASLQDALDTADWEMFRRSSDNISEFAEAVLGFIEKLTNDCVTKHIVKTFPNQKPWVDKNIREALRARTAAYNAALTTGNKEEYKAASYNVRRAVKEAKQRYGKKLEDIYIMRCRTRARRIAQDPSHPNNRLFSLLPSGKRFRLLRAKTERLRRSFFPQALRLLNEG